MIPALLILSVIAVFGFGIALAMRSKQDFAEQNEVVPGRRSPAPASWAGAHTREAKLHRRLGDAVRGARQNPRFAELGLAEQTAAIETEAMAIDERLVAAAALPASHKDAALDEHEANVVRLEAAIAEMITNITVADSKELLEHAVSTADIRLKALAEARAEVERIDREVAGTVSMPAATDAEQAMPQPSSPPHPPTTSPLPPPGTAGPGTASS